MSRLDVVIFGATGFTGAKTVEEMVRIAKKYPGLAWGVAGRSQSKLEELMASLGKKTGEDLSGIKMIVADVTDEQSIKDMCLQARVVANCAGPYRMYGEPVVKAAVEAKTHVVDVSGESQVRHKQVFKSLFPQWRSVLKGGGGAHLGGGKIP
ncbi:lipid droplet localized protein-like [Choristoneura fumiferana]|uniref:lipid droplet localized protein-like n=1 Tax=Choristoneura fumiferana TaxID=7141 RepID=UPI003D154291